jgi:hypothetical protein
MLPLLPLLLSPPGLAMIGSVAPAIVRQISDLLGDSRAADQVGEIAGQAVEAIGAIAGSTEPAAVAAALADPERVAALQVRLAEIRAAAEAQREAARLEQLRAMLSDVASARAHGLGLVQAGSRMAWMPAIVTLVLFLLFGGMLGMIVLGGVPESASRLADQMVTGVYTLLATAVAYWVGTSRGAVEMRQGLQSNAAAPPAAAPDFPTPRSFTRRDP